MKILTLPAQLDSLGTIGQYIMSVCREAGISQKKAYNLRLAVDEFVSNIIIYGYDDCPQVGILEISAEINPERLIIVVIDDSKPYDIRERVFDQSILELPIEERPIGGLGVFLSLHNVDEFSYKVDQDRNISSFFLNRSGMES